MENKSCIEDAEEMMLTPFFDGELRAWGWDIAQGLRQRGHDPADAAVAEGEAEYYAEGWCGEDGLVRGMPLEDFIRELTAIIMTA